MAIEAAPHVDVIFGDEPVKPGYAIPDTIIIPQLAGVTDQTSSVEILPDVDSTDALDSDASDGHDLDSGKSDALLALERHLQAGDSFVTLDLAEELSSNANADQVPAKRRLIHRIGEAVRSKLSKRQQIKEKISNTWLKPQAALISLMASSREKQDDKSEAKRGFLKKAAALGILAVGAYVAHRFLEGNTHHVNDLASRYHLQKPVNGDVFHFTAQPTHQATSGVASRVARHAQATLTDANKSKEALATINKLDHGNIATLYPWEVANTLNPAHTTQLMNQADAQMNAIHGTHYVLTAHDGTEMFMQGNQVITPHDQLLLDEQIAKLSI